MKKVLTLALAVLMVLSLAVMTVSAGSFDSAFKGDVKFTVLSKYGSAVLGGYQMRAFCVDKRENAKYYYGGTLQEGPKFFKFDANTGAKLAVYEFSHDAGAYIKGCASDDRGYVYAGVANKANNGEFFFSILDAETWTEQSYLGVKIAGKLGVNGAGIAKLGTSYYLYVVCNYDTNRLYRFNVTDPKKPTLDTSWGNNGFYELADYGLKEGAGVCCDEAGNIYVAGNGGSGSKGDTLVKLNSAGKKQTTLAVKEIWGIDYTRGYIYCATRNSAKSEVVIVDAASMTQVASYIPEGVGEGFSGVGIMNNKIYVCDHNKDDKVYVSNALNIPAVTTAPATTKAAATAAAAKTATAAKTADMSVVIAAVATVALAGVVVCKKKH